MGGRKQGERCQRWPGQGKKARKDEITFHWQGRFEFWNCLDFGIVSLLLIKLGTKLGAVMTDGDTHGFSAPGRRIIVVNEPSGYHAIKHTKSDGKVSVVPVKTGCKSMSSRPRSESAQRERRWYLKKRKKKIK